MLALATVVEIDNRYTRQRFTVILPMPRPRLIARLKKYLTAVDPETGERVSTNNDPFGVDPLEGCLFIDPRGPIRLVIYATGETDTAATRGELDNGRMMEPNPAALEASEEGHIIDNLAENLRRLMDAESITLDTLAGLTDMRPERLAEILNKQGPGALLDEVCNLAECLGTTTEALMRRRKDQRAGE